MYETHHRPSREPNKRNAIDEMETETPEGLEVTFVSSSHIVVCSFIYFFAAQQQKKKERMKREKNDLAHAQTKPGTI